jgi:hypothetical protein
MMTQMTNEQRTCFSKDLEDDDEEDDYDENDSNAGAGHF